MNETTVKKKKKKKVKHFLKVEFRSEIEKWRKKINELKLILIIHLFVLFEH